MIRYFILFLLIIGFLSIPYFAKCQIDSTPTEFPSFQIIGKDSAICYSLLQARKIDAWLSERDFLKSQYKTAKEAIKQANKLVKEQEQLSDKYKLDAKYWKKIAKKRNRETALIGSGISAAAAGIILYLVLKK